jgi:hypothetical protein
MIKNFNEWLKLRESENYDELGKKITKKSFGFKEEAINNFFYHGSDSEKIVGTLYSNERDSGWFGSGFYLTAYPWYAERWGKYIHKMIPPAGKYAEVNCDNQWNNIEYVGDAKQADQAAGGKVGWIENEHLWSQKFKDSLEEMGYVGVRVNVGELKNLEIVVFDPSKIQVLSESNRQFEKDMNNYGCNYT